MKRLKKLTLISILLLFYIFVMTGCSAGSTIDTTLNISQDLSGSREMKIVIDQSVFKDYFTGSIEDLNAVIGQTCPAQMTWEYSDADGNMTYTMKIDFTSPEDYQSKIAQICGGEPEVKMQAPDSVWANGIYVEESFRDTELVQWMKDAIVANGFVSESNAGMIFNTGSTKVVYNDNSYDSSSQIYVDNVEYVSINSIDILTDIIGLDMFNRTVVFTIPGSSMEKKASEITAYMDGIVPSNAAGEWTDVEADKVFTVKAENLTANGIKDFDASVFEAAGSSMDARDAAGDFSPFTFSSSYTENVDLSNYIVSSSTYTYCNYLIKVKAPYEFCFFTDGGYLLEQGYESDKYPGYQLFDEQSYDGEILNYPVLIQKAYMVSDLDISTGKSVLNSKWTRKSVFSLVEVPTEEEQAQMVQTLLDRAGIESAADAGSTAAAVEDTAASEAAEESGSKKASVEISGEQNKEGVYEITVVQKGKADQMAESFQALFGGEGTLDYAKDKAFWKVRKQEAFNEELDYTAMLENNMAADFTASYMAKLGVLSHMDYDMSNANIVEMKGGKLTAQFDRGDFYVTYAGSRTDIWAIVFWVLIAAGVVMAVIGILRSGIIDWKKIAVAKKASDNSVPEISIEPEKAAAFCEKCGAPREDNGQFCTICGAKFED